MADQEATDLQYLQEDVAVIKGQVEALITTVVPMLVVGLSGVEGGKETIIQFAKTFDKVAVAFSEASDNKAGVPFRAGFCGALKNVERKLLKLAREQSE